MRLRDIKNSFNYGHVIQIIVGIIVVILEINDRIDIWAALIAILLTGVLSFYINTRLRRDRHE